VALLPGLCLLLEWFVASGHVGFWVHAGKGGRQPNTYNHQQGHGGQEGTDSEDLSPIGFQHPGDNHFAQNRNNRDLHGHTDRNALLLQIDDQQPEQFNQDQDEQDVGGDRVELQGGKQGFLKKPKPLPCSWFEPIKGAKLAMTEQILARYIV